MDAFRHESRRIVDVEDTEWSIDTYGTGQLELVMVHGIRHAGSIWKPLIDHLDLNRYTITTVDLPGCGSSPAPSSTLTILDLARQLLQVMTLLGLRDPRLLGHSLGAAICLQAGLLERDLIRQMVLFAPIPISGMDFMDQVQLARLRYPSEKELGRFIRSEFVLPPDPQTLASLIETAKRCDVDSVQAAISSMIQLDLRADVSETDVPILVVCGDRDRHVPIEEQFDVWKRLPQGELHVFHNIAHLPFWDATMRVARLIDGFVFEFSQDEDTGLAASNDCLESGALGVDVVRDASTPHRDPAG